MTPIQQQIETAKKVVAAYVKALNRLDVKPITFLVHPYFHFRYASGYPARGLSNDWRYLGYLYQTFALMKKEGVKVSAEMALIRDGSIAYPSVLLHPPHDRRIIFPNEKRLIEICWIPTPEKDIFLRTRVKDGKIFRVQGLLMPDEYQKLIEHL